jgi:hypothetical protein
MPFPIDQASLVAVELFSLKTAALFQAKEKGQKIPGYYL